jgi:cysteine desulfurase
VVDTTYLDHNASSPLLTDRLGDVSHLFKLSQGNPSSLHAIGRAARRLINESAESLSTFVSCSSDEVFWTSGASESNSWILNSASQFARKNGRRPRLILSAIEHDSVRLAAKGLEAEILELRVKASGEVDLDHLRELLSIDGPIDCVAVLHVNNETGVIQPIAEAATLCKEKGIFFHVDCVQSLGKEKIRFKELGLSSASFSGHKVGAPKGVGALVVARDYQKSLFPLIHGLQQSTRRGGTENAFGVSSFGKILESELQGKRIFPEQLLIWRNDFEAELKRRIPSAEIHGASAPRVSNTTFVGFEGLDGDSLLMKLDLEGICASAGSACTTGSLNPSHVLLAMGYNEAMARSSVRFSAGSTTTWKDYERVLDVLPRMVSELIGARK